MNNAAAVVKFEREVPPNSQATNCFTGVLQMLFQVEIAQNQLNELLTMHVRGQTLVGVGHERDQTS